MLKIKGPSRAWKNFRFRSFCPGRPSGETRGGGRRVRCAGEAGGSGRGGAARTDPGKVQAGSPLADGGGVTGAGPPPGARPRAGPGRTSDRGEGGRRCLLLLTSCRPRAQTPGLPGSSRRRPGPGRLGRLVSGSSVRLLLPESLSARHHRARRLPAGETVSPAGGN